MSDTPDSPLAPAEAARATTAAQREARRRDREAEVPQLFAQAGDKLTPVERFNIGFVRGTLTGRLRNGLMGLAQRTVGQGWVHHCTKNLRTEHGLERLPDPSTWRRFILVSNHRSYFDLFVVSMILFRAGLRPRMIFPVRANFFYDAPLGWFVNGVMSWFSMYPPIFRDRKKLVLNHTAMGELSWLLTHHDVGVGIHPEGTRNQTDDPYTLLPAQSGVGRLIHQARVPVYPVFINGLINNFPQQIASNFVGGGRPVVVVFGAPVDMDDLLAEPPTARTYKLIAERTQEVITALGQEEKAHRAALPPVKSSGA